jgi:Exopolysaccharide biosynthesis protein YbjH
VLISFPKNGFAQSGFVGISGIGEIPDARIMPDGNLKFLVSSNRPYTIYSASLGLSRRLELNGRITSISGVPGFSAGDTYGVYKDKAFDAKLRIIDEMKYTPQISIGGEDLTGTKSFAAHYVVLGKNFESLDLSLGRGDKRFNGNFYGARLNLYRDSDQHFNLTINKSRIQHATDYYANLSNAGEIKSSLNFGAEYQFGWLSFGLQTNKNKNTAGLIAIAIPLNKKEFVPKIDEPQAFANRPQNASENHKNDGGQIRNPLRRELISALEAADFSQVKITWNQNTEELILNLQNERLSSTTKQLNAALKILAYYAGDFSEKSKLKVKINFFDNEVVTYSIDSIKLVLRLVDQNKPYDELVFVEHAKYLSYSKPDADVSAATSMLIKKNDGKLKTFFAPNLSLHLNDPSKLYHYSFGLIGGASWRPFEKSDVQLELSKNLMSDFNQVTQKSNSQLPHVRSDIADYKSEKGIKITRLTANHFTKPAATTYIRSSIGFYEEMFLGTGIQALHFIRGTNVAIDASVDFLRQRDFRGLWGVVNYRATTAIAALHFKPLSNLELTIRGGRFLAGDVGLRYEALRRFDSGVELGAWYSLTNAYDTLNWGGVRYRDKGILFSVPLRIFETKDSQKIITGSISPWARDVAQLVKSPNDLYGSINEYFKNMDER